MTFFTCPVCGLGLEPGEKTCRCPAGHAFDRARSGYLNLLLSPSAHAHGDDKEMLAGRRAFLDRGSYRPLSEEICRLLTASFPAGGVLLDAGCGEGSYTAALFSALSRAGKSPRVFGADISKEAARLSAGRLKEGEFAVASVYRLPLADASCDAVISVFSPHAPEEFFRVLKPGGVLLRAFPLEEHLFELKEAVYERPTKNSVSFAVDPGFTETARREIRFPLELPDPQAIRDLFAMTPYAHKTSPEDRKKLDLLTSLTVTAAFGVTLWRKD